MSQGDFGNLQVDAKTGRMSLSPKVMGLDPGETMKKIIEVDTETLTKKPKEILDKIDKKVTSLSEFEAMVQDYITTLKPLRGGAEGTTPAGHLAQLDPQAFSLLNAGTSQAIASQPVDLIELFTTDATNLTNFNLQINQIAQVDIQKSLTGFTSTSLALGVAGTITFNSTVPITVNVTPTMSLNDIMDTINSQQNVTGVMASNIAVTTTDNRLFFQSKQTGTPLNITYSPSLQALGDQMPPDTSKIVSLQGVSNPNSALNISGNMILGASHTSISVGAMDSLTTIAASINAQTGITNITARIVEYNPNDSRLLLTTVDGSPLELSSDPSLQIAQLPTNATAKQTLLSAHLEFQGTQVTRPSNQINDLIPGSTLTLKKADPNTTVFINMVSPTKKVTEDIQAWITQHNKTIDFIRSQRVFNPEDGTIAETFLRDSKALNNVHSLLGMSLSSFVSGVPTNTASSLMAIGINLGSDGKLSIDQTPDPRTRKTVLESMIEDNLSQVSNVLTFNAKSSNSQFTLNSHPSNVSDQITQNGLIVTYSLDMSGTPSAQIQAGNLSFTAGASLVINGSSVTIKVAPNDPHYTLLNGFTFNFNNTPPLTAGQSATTTLSMSQGIADRLLNNFEGMFYPGDEDPITKKLINKGQFGIERDELIKNKEDTTERLKKIEDKIESKKKMLMVKYAQMTAAITKLMKLQEQIKSMNNQE